MLVAVLLCSKLNRIIFGYFDPTHILFDKMINCFWVALTDVSAKTNALVSRRWHVCAWACMMRRA